MFAVAQGQAGHSSSHCHRPMGDFILAGSQQFGLMSHIGQSLAGRVGRIELLPFSMTALATADLLPRDLDTLLWRGAYPTPV